jgi:murein DD-endopeptidase MepM/ murein hydrolase activator NlpD
MTDDNDEKTVIVRRPIQPAQPARPPQAATSAEPASTAKVAAEPTVIKPQQKPPAKSGVKKAEAKLQTKANPKPPAKPQKPQKAKPPQPVSQKKRTNAPVIALTVFALALIGIGSALTTVYVFSPKTGEEQVAATYTDAELDHEIVSVEDDASAAEDEALIRAAIKPKIIDLSGDPVVIRQLSAAPRQLVKLEADPQRKAAQGLGVKGEIFRLRDSLDSADANLRNGLLGDQDDIATRSTAPVGKTPTPDVAAEDEDGSSTVIAGGNPGARIAEFAETIREKTTVAAKLQKLGAAEAPAKAAEIVFAEHYQSASLQQDDRIAVRMVTGGESANTTLPVQMSLYRRGELVGSLALNDIEKYTPSADPWLDRDIFEAPLLPEIVNPEDQPRLLDAIYATALRNRLPAPVTGETIMLLSRAFDLEQKLQPGDNITLIYSPDARDSKTGLGRIVYVGVSRTSGDLECFVSSSSSGEFSCANLDASNVPTQPGIIKPVNGVVAAKFGPQGDTGSPDEVMNYGTEWTAPKGSPVISAFAGQVTSIGRETGYGNVVRLSHADGSTTMYAYLERAQTGLGVGTQVKAGQNIGYVGTPPTSREPRLYFELRRGGVPVDPEGEMQASVGSGNAVDQFVHRIITIESGNNCRAKNPLSSATGLGQFIDSTWMSTIRLHRPDLLKGRSRREVLDMRFSCDLSRAMTTAFTRDNAAVIRRSGHAVTPGNLYLAHFLGVGGAVKTLGNNQNAQIAAVFGEHHVRANPFERGKTLGWLVSWAAKKMGGKSPKYAAKQPDPIQTANTNATKRPRTPDEETKTVAAPASTEPLIRSEADPQLAQLKAAINTLIE